MLRLWNKTDNIIQPNGVSYSPEEIMNDPNFGFSRHVETVLEMQGPITVAIDNIHILLQVYDLDPALTGQAALDAIIAAKQKQKEQAAEQAAAIAPLAAAGLDMTDQYLIERMVKLIPAVVVAVDNYREKGQVGVAHG